METTTIIVHHLQAAMVVVTARLRLVVTVIVRRPVQMDLTTADHALAAVLVLVAEAHVLTADPMADRVLVAEVLVLMADPMADHVLAADHVPAVLTAAGANVRNLAETVAGIKGLKMGSPAAVLVAIADVRQH